MRPSPRVPRIATLSSVVATRSNRKSFRRHRISRDGHRVYALRVANLSRTNFIPARRHRESIQTVGPRDDTPRCSAHRHRRAAERFAGRPKHTPAQRSSVLRPCGCAAEHETENAMKHKRTTPFHRRDSLSAGCGLSPERHASGQPRRPLHRAAASLAPDAWSRDARELTCEAVSRGALSQTMCIVLLCDLELSVQRPALLERSPASKAATCGWRSCRPKRRIAFSSRRIPASKGRSRSRCKGNRLRRSSCLRVKGWRFQDSKYLGIYKSIPRL